MAPRSSESPEHQGVELTRATSAGGGMSWIDAVIAVGQVFAVLLLVGWLLLKFGD